MSVRIGDLALAAGAVTAAQLEQARALQKTNGSRLGAALVGLGYLTEEQGITSLEEVLRETVR